MKSILVPCDESEAMASELACANLLASSLGSVVEGIALRPIHVEIVAPDPIVAVTFPPADWNDADFVAKARKGFEAHFAGSSVKFRWRGGPSIDDAGLGSLARVYDITVIGRPNAGGAGPRMTTLESALFESGQPVLVAPPVAPAKMGENIVVSWNCSTEQASATASAIPLLRKAKTVTVITIEGLTVPGPSGAQCCDWLATHGIDAPEISMGNGGRKPGEVLLSEAEKLGADLIVVGNKGMTGARRFLLGSVPNKVSHHAPCSVFIARTT